MIKPFYQGTRLDWTGLATASVLFVAFYVLAHASTPSTARAGLIGLTTLGALYVPINAEESGIFAFVAAIYAADHPGCASSGHLIGINLLLLTEALYFHLNLWTWVGGGGRAVLISLIVLLNGRERDANLELRLAQDEIGRLAKLAERDRITRDLHDVLGHTLSLIAMKSELAQKRFSMDPKGTLVEMQEVEVISRQALMRVREAIHGYSATSFMQEVDRISAALLSVGVNVQCALGDVAMTSLQESMFAKVLEEASTNIIRHAHAGCCQIELQTTSEMV